MNPASRVLVTALFALALAATARDAKATVLESVSLDTSGLAGPFELAFILTDGSGIGDANNTVTVTNFAFGPGGSPGSVDKALTSGGASGDLATGVTLVDDTFLSIFASAFVPGTELSFRLGATTDGDAGGTPDLLSLVLLDGNGNLVGTQDPSGVGSLLTFEIGTNGPVVATFASDLTPAPVVTAVATASEPGNLSLVALAAILAIGCARAGAGRPPLREQQVPS